MISTVIIAKNEADRISKTIASAITITDEVIVLDTGSEDQTIKVSEATGAKVISVPWEGYGQTKNHGHKYAKNDWILSLDADEVLSRDLQKSIKELELERGSVFLLDRMVNIENQWIRHSGWHPDWVYRLFHKNDCQWNEALVHEKLHYATNSKLIKLDGVLEHYSFRSMTHFKEKINHYAMLAAQDWKSKGSSPSVFKKIFGAKWKYFHTYYLKAGYKDGEIGKEIAKVMAEGVRKKIQYFKEL